MSGDPKTNEWTLLKDQFAALKDQFAALLHDENVSDDSIESRRFAELINRTAGVTPSRWRFAKNRVHW